MSVLVIMIGASLLIALGFLSAFLWSVKHGQYDDDQTPAIRILFDDKNDEPVSDHHQHNNLNQQK